MEITWIGHSSFRLRAGDQTLVTDPFPDGLGFTMGPQEAGLVTISNEHPNHSNLAALGGSPYCARNPGEYDVDTVYIRGIRTPPGPSDPPDKRNTAFVIEMDGVSVCHLGDISHALASSLVEEMGNVDVVLAPAGGGCTLAPSAIAEVVRQLEARIVIPMHYRVPALKVDLGLGGPDAFLKEFGATAVEPQVRLSVTSSNLPPEPRVVVLLPAGKPLA